MPARRRHQELKRKLRIEVAKLEAEEREQLRFDLASPLDDLYWREHERSPHDPDDDCYFGCPHLDPTEVRAESDAHLKEAKP